MPEGNEHPVPAQQLGPEISRYAVVKGAKQRGVDNYLGNLRYHHPFLSGSAKAPFFSRICM